VNSKPPPPDDVAGLILAAGSGERLGGRYKALLTHKGETLLERVKRLAEPFCSQIITGLPKELLANHDGIEGGATRIETVRRLLAETERPYVLILEAARPFATAEQCSAVLAEAAVSGAALFAHQTPVRDSLAIARDGALETLLPRERIVQLQTPRACRTDWLKDALKYGEATHELILLQKAGYRTTLLPGSTDNIKITYPEDLALLES